MAKTIEYVNISEAAREYNVSVDTVKHLLKTNAFQGAFNSNKTWNIPRPEAERLLAKFKSCVRMHEVEEKFGINQSKLSKLYREGKIVGWKPNVGSNGRTGATYIDMGSLERYLASERTPVPDPMPVVRSITPTVHSTPTPSTEDMALLRGAIETLAGTVSALAQSQAVQGTATNELSKQVKNLSDWLGELAIQKAQQ